MIHPTLMAAEFANKFGYFKKQFVRLSLQVLLNREGLDLSVITLALK
jgi:hypothetical protein